MASEVARLRILDTDAVTKWQLHAEAVEPYLLQFPPDQRAVTIVTVEEKLRGRLAFIARAKEPDRVVRAYHYLLEELDWFTRIRILPFTDAVAAKFNELRAQGLRIGTLDLRIAAIALTLGGVVVTRNRRDFSQVPGLVLEDWTQT
jgi:tRNA(fMet)-specific endonuclease VapC